MEDDDMSELFKLADIAPILVKIAPKLEKALEDLPEVLGSVQTRIASLENRVDLLTKMHAQTQSDVTTLKTNVVDLLEALKSKMNNPE